MTKKEVIKIYSDIRVNKRKCIEDELRMKEEDETHELKVLEAKEKAPHTKEIQKIDAKYGPEYIKIRAKYNRHSRCPDTMPPALAKFDVETNKKILDYANDITPTLME